MLVGVAGAGKSTVANELMVGRDDIVYISSDIIREEMLGDINNQEKNSDVFVEMAKRTKESLLSGKHVIYDATNISRKKRQGLLRQIPNKLDVEKVVIYMATPFKTINEQNNNRERVVPTNVVDKMYKTMQVPIYSEGWDKIVIEYDNDTIEYDLPKQFTDAVRAGVLLGREGYDLMKFLASYFDEFFDVYDMPQDSKYHAFSASRHIYHVYKYVLENYEGEDKEEMLWASLLHDVGKKHCKSFTNRKGDETKYASFIGHELVGAQMAIPFLKKMNFEDKFIYNVSTLVQFHMYLLDENANRDKLKRYVGEDFFTKLEILRDADTLSH